MRAFNRADKILKPKKDCSKISRSVSGRAYYGINSVPDLLYYDLVTCLYTELSWEVPVLKVAMHLNQAHSAFQHSAWKVSEIQLTELAEETLERERGIWLHAVPQELGITNSVTDNWHIYRPYMCRSCEAICRMVYKIMVTTGWVVCDSKKKTLLLLQMTPNAGFFNIKDLKKQKKRKIVATGERMKVLNCWNYRKETLLTLSLSDYVGLFPYGTAPSVLPKLV